MKDITELEPVERQAALKAMPMWELVQTMRDLMANQRITEVAARLDAMTVYIMRTHDR